MLVSNARRRLGASGGQSALPLNSSLIPPPAPSRFARQPPKSKKKNVCQRQNTNKTRQSGQHSASKSKPRKSKIYPAESGRKKGGKKYLAKGESKKIKKSEQPSQTRPKQAAKPLKTKKIKTKQSANPNCRQKQKIIKK
jgi:hypothetical protein